MPGQAPAVTDERELLLAYIAQQRDGIRYAAFGLTDEQARLAPSASSLSIGGPPTGSSPGSRPRDVSAGS